MLTMNDLNPLLRRRSTVTTGEGDKVGTVGVVYLNDVDEQPTWVTVHTGLFGSRESFVPLEGASVRGHDLVVAYPRELIRHAPAVDRDGHLSPEEEAALYRHYGLQVIAPPRDATRPGSDAVAASAIPGEPSATSAEPSAPPVGSAPAAVDELDASSSSVEAPSGRETAEKPRTPAPSEPAEDPDLPRSGNAVDSSMQSGVRMRDDGGTPWVVRSEERLRVGTEQYEAGRVRLRKYVVTEEDAVSVPLVTEEVQVVVEPITSSTGVDLGGPFREETVELVGREEIAVVTKETVAVEQVRMRTVEVAGRATVRDTVRKERVAVTVDGDAADEIAGADRTPAKRRKSGRAKAGTPSRRDPRQPSKDAATTAVKSTNALVKGKKKRR